MNDFLAAVKAQLNTLNEKYTKEQKIRAAIAAALVLAVLIFAVTLLTKTTYETLYSGMDEGDAATVYARLKNEMSVDVKLEGSGTILVPENQVEDLRMQLLSEGYPQSGFNYDIYEASQRLGATEEEKRLYKEWQLGDHIRKTIMMNNKVREARVIVTLQSESAFVLAQQATPSSASITLALQPGEILTNEEARTIARLAMTSVAGLTMDNISVQDTDFNLYNLSEEAQYNLTDDLALQDEVRKQFENQVRRLLLPVFGDMVSVNARAELEFDNRVSESKIFTPVDEENMAGIVVSYQTLIEVIEGTDDAVGEPGVDENSLIPGYVEEYTDNGERYKKIAHEANLEVNETITRVTEQRGKLKNLWIAVLIDSRYEAETEKVRSLVANAIGVRDEHVSVATIEFLRDSEEEWATYQQQLLEEQAKKEREDLIKNIINAVVILVFLILTFLLLRPLTHKKSAVVEGEFEVLGGEEEGDGGEDDEDDEELLEALNAAQADALSLDTIEEKTSGVRDAIEQFIDKNPEAVARLLRNWLSD